jgi:hypothetical protein
LTAEAKFSKKKRKKTNKKQQRRKNVKQNANKGTMQHNKASIPTAQWQSKQTNNANNKASSTSELTEPLPVSKTK